MKEKYLRLLTAQTLALAVALMTCAQLGFAQSAREYHRTLPVTSANPVTLDVHLSEGELQIAYGRDEQVSIMATARAPVGMKVGEESFAAPISVEQDGNHVRNLCQKVNGGGKRIEAHTESGKIVIRRL